MDLGAQLIDSLGIAAPACVALVGAGGKTTLMLSLYAEGLRRGWPVTAATTAQVAAVQVIGIDGFVHGGQQGDKLTGASFETIAALPTGLVVVEADGARSKVVKAPAAHEPMVPPNATHVIAVIGADALDRVIEDVAHRPMLVAAVCGCGPYSRLTVQRAATLLASDRGGRKGVPLGADFAVAITCIGPRQQNLAHELATLLEQSGVRTVLLGLR